MHVHARACLHMLRRLARCLAPLVSRPVSRQSRLRTLVFPGKTRGFAAEGVGFELDTRCLETLVLCVQAETAYPLMRKLI